MVNLKMKIGNKLKSIREERKLTQSEIAHLLNLSTSPYQRLEHNETYVSFEQLLKISKEMDVPVQEFLPDTLTINNSHNKQAAFVVLGNQTNNNYYIATPEQLNDNEENQSLKDKIENLYKILKDNNINIE